MRKILNRIEFWFVKPHNKAELLAEISKLRHDLEGCSGEYYKLIEKRFGSVKVMYGDGYVRKFKLSSWVYMGEGILNNLTNIKVKRYGRN